MLVRIVVAILLLGITVVLLLAVLAHRTPWLMADEAMYARGAWNLVHRGFMLPHVPRAMNYPPVYPMVLSIPAAVVDIESSYIAYQIVNIVLLAMGGIIAYGIARSYRRGVFPLIVSALYMITPSAVVYVPMIMSENLTALLMLFVGYAIHKWSLRQEPRWLLWGWAAALAAPFCRVTALLVPVAFLMAIRSHPEQLSLRIRRWTARVLLLMACAAALLLVVLPTSVVRIYHPWSTITVIVKTLFSTEGWAVLLRHVFANFSLLLAASGGLAWLLVLKGRPDELPIRRYLQVLLFGLLVVTIGYMQYGSAGPHGPLYAAAQRYMDPGIAASIPWLLVLTHRIRRSWAVFFILVAALLAAQFCPRGGFKAGQTLASAGLGLGIIEFPSIVATVPRSLAIVVLSSLVPLVLLALPGQRFRSAALLMLILFVPLSFDALQHGIAMSSARENAEPKLWELSTAVPPDAEILVEEQDADEALMNTLFSGLFWLPWNNVYIVESSLVQSVRGRPIVQLTKRWLPDRLVHSGTHKWYLRGHSAPAVTSSRLFYDFGQGDDRYLFAAPPSDEGYARWSGENPVIELALIPARYRLYLSHRSRPEYAECDGRATLNETHLGRFTSADTLVSFEIEPDFLRPDGRQLLKLRISPRSNPSGEGQWLHGIRLDWICCVPLSEIDDPSGSIVENPLRTEL